MYYVKLPVSTDQNPCDMHFSHQEPFFPVGGTFGLKGFVDYTAILPRLAPYLLLDNLQDMEEARQMHVGACMETL